MFYYLTKPYDIKVLLAIIQSALYDTGKDKRLTAEIHNTLKACHLLESGKFRFRTLEEYAALSNLVSTFCPNPMEALFGIDLRIC